MLKALMTAVWCLAFAVPAVAQSAPADQNPAPPEKQAEKKEEKKEDTTLKAQWKDGLRLETADKSFSAQIGGRIQNDWAFMEGDDAINARFGQLEDGTEFRRARLNISGLAYERMEFKIQLDFATGSAVFRDVYLGMRKIPKIGNIRIGQFKEPFGLEEQASDDNVTFMERSLADQFAPSRHTGIMIHDRAAGERISWALGVFRDTNDVGLAVGDEGYALTGRFTGLPWRKDNGRRLLHLGIAYSRRNTPASIRYRERPEAHLAPRLVDTGVFPAESVDLLGTEIGFVYGAASLQGEYIISDSHSPLAPDTSLKGFYVAASYFLTGENRPYSGSEATFGRVRPKRSFLAKTFGPGAWELAARYSKIDLTDRPIVGGELQDWTVGVNWHLNPNCRIMWNYVRADLLDVGVANIGQMRFQVDF